MNSPLSSLALYPRDTAQSFSAGADFKKRILIFVMNYVGVSFCTTEQEDGWLSIPLHSNPFHLYFSVVPREQDEWLI